MRVTKPTSRVPHNKVHMRRPQQRLCEFSNRPVTGHPTRLRQQKSLLRPAPPPGISRPSLNLKAQPMGPTSSTARPDALRRSYTAPTHTRRRFNRRVVKGTTSLGPGRLQSTCSHRASKCQAFRRPSSQNCTICPRGRHPPRTAPTRHQDPTSRGIRAPRADVTLRPRPTGLWCKGPRHTQTPHYGVKPSRFRPSNPHCLSIRTQSRSHRSNSLVTRCSTCRRWTTPLVTTKLL